MNSERNSPIPSAPYDRAFPISSGSSMFAIGKNRTPSSVTGPEPGDLLELPPVVVVLLLLAQELFPDGRRRIDDDLAVRAVDDERVAAPDLLGDVVEADDGRDVEGAGQDGDVGRRAAHVQGHGQDLPAAQPEGGFGGKEVVGDQDPSRTASIPASFSALRFR